MTTQCVTGK